jgi:endo-1,4-beta-xylanase
MKWRATEPSQGNFTFAGGDALSDFAVAHGMQVKGHTLVWYASLPTWVSELAVASDVRAAMVNHIQAVVSHYAGKVKAWDVVNEAFDDGNPASYRRDVIFDQLGETYIDEAFEAARAADPNALLFYNEYGIEGPGSKLDATYALVQRLIASNVPIDGVGFQMHIAADGDPTPSALAASMKKFTDLGLWVNISEMDVRAASAGSDLATQFDVQKQRYHDIVAVCVRNPKCMSITTWGVTDDRTWLDDPAQLSWAGPAPHNPLLFSADGSAKPAYDGVIQALLEQ